MSMSERASMLALAIVAGFVGGFVSDRLLQVREVSAQTGPVEVIRAKKIEVLGENGGGARLAIGDDGTPELVLASPSERRVTTLTPNGLVLVDRDRETGSTANLTFGDDGVPRLRFLAAKDVAQQGSGTGASYTRGGLVIDDNRGEFRLALSVDLDGKSNGLEILSNVVDGRGQAAVS